MKLLYVEDNPFDRDLTRRALLKQVPDLIWDSATSVTEAIKRLDENVYDVLLLDMWLPDGNSLGVLLRARRLGLDTAVVVVAGAGDEASAMQFLKAGAQDYLPKRGNYLDRIGASLQEAIVRKQNNLHPASLLTVLYVEAHADDIDLTRRHFDRHAPHLSLVVQPDGVSALAWLDCPDNHADVAMLDLRLPDMTGLELLAAIKSRGEMPCILITGRGDEIAVARAMSLGAVDYIIKGHGYVTALPYAVEHAHVLTAYLTLRQATERTAIENEGE